MTSVETAVIVDALRTPIGRYGGALKDVRPDDLAALVVREAVQRNALDPAGIEDVYFGDATRRERTTVTWRAWQFSSPGCRLRSRPPR